jgi:hypothetical protein
MFLGHVALGFAAKRATPGVSLGMLVLAAQLADTLWPAFVGLGLERVAIDPGNTAVTPLDFVSYPYSHSLALLTLWGLGFAWVCVRADAAARSSPPVKIFAVAAALVVSHWVLDFVTHRPDMPLYPGGARYGLGLWNSVAATVAIELAMYAAGVWIYVRTTRARDRIGRWAFAGLTGFLVLAYAANIAGPPPPSVSAIWMAGFPAAIVLTLWAWWADRHRAVDRR